MTPHWFRWWLGAENAKSYYLNEWWHSRIYASQGKMSFVKCCILTKIHVLSEGHHLDISRLHDDVIEWKPFPRYWPFVRGIHRSPVNSSHKGQWRGDLMFSLICAWINGWVNNREAGDLRRYRAHCDISVMISSKRCCITWNKFTHWGPNKMYDNLLSLHFHIRFFCYYCFVYS